MNEHSPDILGSLSITTWIILCCALLLLVFAFTINDGITEATASASLIDLIDPTVQRLPGPSGLAGKLFMLRMRKGTPKMIFEEVSNYGKVFGVGEGEDTKCFIQNHERLEEAFVVKSKSFSDRGGIIPTLMASLQKRGSISNNSDAWIEARDFVSQTIKNADFGHTTVASCIDASIPQLTEAIDRHNGESLDPKIVFQYFFTDVLHRITYGESINYDDKIVQGFIQSLDDVFLQTVNPGMFVLAWPSLSKGCQFSGYRAKLQNSAKYVKLRAEETLLKRDAVHAASSLVALFARNIERLRAAGQATSSEPEDGWRLAYDLFFAACDTVHEVLLWAILFLVVREDVQERMRIEIQNVAAASDTPISYKDKDRLPFVMATMLEVLRMRPVTPMGVPHFASEEGSFGGFEIPKGTQIFTNLWGIHNDPEVWNAPTEFEPSRFLTADGEMNEERVKLVVPFSVGPRSCSGEHVARMTIFNTLITLLSKYRISLPMNDPQPRLVDEIHLFTIKPDRFQVIFERLQQCGEP